MNSDCTVEIDGGLINVRVGAIIMKGDKFLMVGNERQDYLYSVGGRVKFGETAEDAIIREVYEETGVKLEVSRLGFIHENYFYGDDPIKKNKLIYEISFYFYMKTPSDFEPKCKSFTEDNCKEKLVWVTADSDIKYFPEFFRTELNNPSSEIQHIVTDDR
ncbi:MAG: NUDIX domain-containing protein [Lachnospiraceae bacterium]|nr:NUDIX domain-containing protein [Lachnospiraceae bacterium]